MLASRMRFLRRFSAISIVCLVAQKCRPFFRSHHAIKYIRLAALLIMGGAIAAILPEILVSAGRDHAEDGDAGSFTMTAADLDKMQRLPGRLGALPAPPIPADNAQSQAKIALGEMLFFDVRLSKDYSTGCSTCHDPKRAYSDGRPEPVGIGRQTLRRRVPSILNSAYNSSQFWDGRASTLEEQAEGPIMDAGEMGMPDEKTLVERLSEVGEYRERFREVFGGEISLRNVARAIAAFERTLVTPDSAFDRYVTGDKQALTDQQKRGLIVFVGRGFCIQCHNGPNFTDNNFYSLGLLSDADSDIGRFSITKDPASRHAFRAPSLRNVALRAPYTHDGTVATLREMLEVYDRGGGRGRKCRLLHRLHLTAREKDDLVSFLQALNGRLPSVNPPAVPPGF